jgi:hypothetical protein
MFYCLIKTATEVKTEECLFHCDEKHSLSKREEEVVLGPRLSVMYMCVHRGALNTSQTILIR